MHEVENMFYVGEKPWHGLGKAFIEPPSLDQAIIEAGLNWEVLTEPCFSGNNEQLPALLTRRSSDSSILGVVGPTYTPYQNSEAFKFFEPFIESGQASIETAGSLRDGKRVFILCKINKDPMAIVGNDTVEKYILLSNSHDGTLAVRTGFTPIRVVCNNTLSMAHRDSFSKLIRAKHTKNIAYNMEKIQEIMNLANESFEATAEQYRVLASKQINSADLEKFVKLVFLNPKVVAASPENNKLGDRVLSNVIPLFEHGQGNDLPGVKGTYWAAYNAVTEYIQHERGANPATRLDQAWFGIGATLNQKALNTAIALAA